MCRWYFGRAREEIAEIGEGATDRENNSDDCPDEVMKHTSGEGPRMPGQALLFAALLRHAVAPNLFLSFLLSDKCVEGIRIDVPHSADAPAFDVPEARQAGNVVQRQIDCACSIARPDVGHAIDDDLA